jgi:hypothetical protein
VRLEEPLSRSPFRVLLPDRITIAAVASAWNRDAFKSLIRETPRVHDRCCFVRREKIRDCRRAASLASWGPESAETYNDEPIYLAAQQAITIMSAAA